MSDAKTFSESWYRIEGETLSLRPGLKVQRQFFRGEKWYVLQDPYNNQYFRLRPAAYEFVARLGRGRTVGQVWAQCLDQTPEDAPGQEEAVRLLAQLYNANLLRYQCPEDTLVLFERYEKQREREIRSRLISFMFPRVTLLDPDRFLAATLPWVRWLFGWAGLLLWLGVVGFGVKSVLDHSGALVSQGQGLLAPANLPWLYVALVFTKIIHEFGHAYLCRHFGGEVHRMGLMFLIFTPMPFVDATSAWSFRARRQRVLVGAAGMIVELFVAAVAAVVWSLTVPGLLHSLCFNIMVIASVSTVIFNANPLLRFDGYYILSDLIDTPNLHERSTRQLLFLAQRLIFGNRDARSLARSRTEACTLFLFAILSFIYRVIVFGSMILIIADSYLALGVILAAGFIFSWVLVPVFRMLKFLLTDPSLGRRRFRACAASAGVLLGVAAFLRIIPFPHTFRSPGVLEADPASHMYVQTPGFLASVSVLPGAMVGPGDELVRFTSPDLDTQWTTMEAKYRELDAYERKALEESTADLEPLRALRQAVDNQKAQLIRSRDELVLRAPHAGAWNGPDLTPLVGTWIGKGREVGSIVAPAAFVFRAVVSKADAARLFGGRIPPAQIRITGQAGRRLEVKSCEIIPMQQSELPSQALGWQGGEVRTETTRGGVPRAVEPFFEVKAVVVPADGVVLRHGLAGHVRFNLPAEPLWDQWSRRFRQMLQKRYRL
ncbi:MAG: hypothetical protein U1G05_12850 [Kiritimatiellia bacterium]